MQQTAPSSGIAYLLERAKQVAFRPRARGTTGPATPDGIVVVGARGHITAVNRRYADIWGTPQPILAGRRHVAYIQHAAEQCAAPIAAFATLEHLFSTTGTVRAELALADGRTLVCLSAPVVYESTGEVRRTLYFRDVPALRQRA
ncbi:MAG: PAS domain-containing protein [Kofleriaceae bacterium]